jgi:hypothetical protein
VPLLYLLYALLRGALSGIYPYPFLDATRIGWTRVTLNAGAIAAAFILVSFLLVAFDRRVQWPGAKGKSSAS